MSFHLKFHLKLWQNDIGLDSDNGINNTESPWEVGNLRNALVLQVSEGPSSTFANALPQADSKMFFFWFTDGLVLNI